MSKLPTAWPLLAATIALVTLSAASAEPALTVKEALGKRIFFDKGLSEPRGQACASCHDPATAFSDPRRGATSEGVIKGFFGPRNAPSILYASFTPALQNGGDDGPLAYIGGQFRDGRANFLEDQAKQPFLNPIEMANPSAHAVVVKLQAANYADQFKLVYGGDIFSNDDAAFNALADALGAFERTKVFAPFSAKFDAYQRGETTLSEVEMRGLAVFTAADKGNCAACHAPTSTKASGRKSLFTDFGYDNVGVPRNPANKFYTMPAQHNPDGLNFVDIGLGNVVLRPYVRGQFKAPTLRNIAVTGPYMHNGYFKTLKGVVDFYNTRDVRPTCTDPFTPEAKAQRQGCWPVAESPDTLNLVDMGNLGLSAQDVDDIVAFLGTLTDGWTPPAAAAGAAVGTTKTAPRR